MLKNRGNKLKKLILSAILLATVTSSYACTISERTTPDVRAIVVSNGGWPISDKNCALLNSNNMKLNVSAEATVLSNTSIGWSLVKISDKKNNIFSETNQYSTQANSSIASMDKANELMYLSIKNAIDTFDFQKAIQEVKAYRAKALK